MGRDDTGSENRPMWRERRMPGQSESSAPHPDSTPSDSTPSDGGQSGQAQGPSPQDQQQGE